MKSLQKDIAQMIDISAVQAPDGETEIKELVRYAQEYNFACIYVLPCWVPFLKELLEENTDILIASSVGFPSGAHTKEIKVSETQQLLKQGVHGLDVMINVGMLRSGRYDYVEDEIKSIVGIAEDIPVKVILETYYLTEDGIKRACELSIKGGAAYVKTSTGWAPGGATRDVISLITSFVGNSIKVKASGGIRTLKDLMDMYRMGVSRFGINLKASIQIMNEFKTLPEEAISI